MRVRNTSNKRVEFMPEALGDSGVFFYPEEERDLPDEIAERLLAKSDVLEEVKPKAKFTAKKKVDSKTKN